MGFSRRKTPLRMTDRVDGILTQENTAQNDGEGWWDSHVACFDYFYKCFLLLLINLSYAVGCFGPQIQTVSHFFLNQD